MPEARTIAKARRASVDALQPPARPPGPGPAAPPSARPARLAFAAAKVYLVG